MIGRNCTFIFLVGVFLGAIANTASAQSLFSDLLKDSDQVLEDSTRDAKELDFNSDFCNLLGGKILRVDRDDDGAPYDLFVPSKTECFEDDWVFIWSCNDYDEGCNDYYNIYEISLSKPSFIKDSNLLCFPKSYALDLPRPFDNARNCFEIKIFDEEILRIESNNGRGNRYITIAEKPLMEANLLRLAKRVSSADIRAKIKNSTFTVNKTVWSADRENLDAWRSGEIARIEQIYFGDEFAWAKVTSGDIELYSSFLYKFQYGDDGYYELCFEKAPGTYWDIVGCYTIIASDSTLRKATVREEDKVWETPIILYDEGADHELNWNKGRKGDVYGLNEKFDDQEASDFWNGLFKVLGDTSPIWLPIILGE